MAVPRSSRAFPRPGLRPISQPFFMIVPHSQGTFVNVFSLMSSTSPLHETCFSFNKHLFSAYDV